jgi:uncharacterized metal-binding protein (TIGR02443 family)
MSDQPPADDEPPVLVKKRFIAGAVCPECRAEDRLRVDYLRAGTLEYQERHCVACGFADRSEAPARGADVLPRIRRGRQASDSAPQVVRILDPDAEDGNPAAKKV